MDTISIVMSCLNIVALTLSIATIVIAKKTWLILARTERMRASTAGSLGLEQEAVEHRRLADKYTRHAWPFRETSADTP